MSYAVKEIFYTLQGEGANAGRPAVFCRFAGCNLWSGREADRAGAVCKFCDTDFAGTDGTGGGKFAAADDLAGRIASHWPGRAGRRFTVLTGGEPALQVDAPLVDALHRRGFEIAIETNGTAELAPGLDWVCVSPKAGTEVRVRRGNELKLVYPQDGAPPEQFEQWGFDHFLLQPMDGPEKRANTQRAIAYCMGNPRWKLSLQTHKLIGIR
jgi:7-carboxy-7-deazaguanine synthase